MVALFKLDKFLLNPQIRTFSGTVPGTFWNADVENQKPSGDRSLKDTHPDAEFSACHARIPIDSDPDETPHMVTGVQEEIPYCSAGTSSGKQKKAPFTSQPHFRSEDTPAIIEADPILLVSQQLPSYRNSANFNNNNNIIRLSSLPKSLKTTMPIFDGEIRKI